MEDLGGELEAIKERLIAIHDKIVDLFPEDAECVFNAALALEKLKGE